MATKTGIEWTDSTWSPLRVRVRTDAGRVAQEKGYTSLVAIGKRMAGRVGPHCEHVSPGCEHCYAETNNHRCLPANGTGLPYDRRSRDLVEAFVDEKALLLPLNWKPVRYQLPSPCGPYVETATRPRRIFVENQSDLFGEWVPDEHIDKVFAIMALCPQHTFQVLTKRPERMLAYMTTVCASVKLSRTVREVFIGKQAGEIHLQRTGDPVFEWPGLPLPNVWLGVSGENQKVTDERVETLRSVPAAVRFLSAEPLLEDLSLYPHLGCHHDDGIGLDWVICGGESGKDSRPCNSDWLQSLVGQCAVAGVSCFVKQMGSHVIQGGTHRRKKDRKGGDVHEWPHELRVQQFPEVRTDGSL